MAKTLRYIIIGQWKKLRSKGWYLLGYNLEYDVIFYVCDALQLYPWWMMVEDNDDCSTWWPIGVSASSGASLYSCTPDWVSVSQDRNISQTTTVTVTPALTRSSLKLLLAWWLVAIQPTQPHFKNRRYNKLKQTNREPWLMTMTVMAESGECPDWLTYCRWQEYYYLSSFLSEPWPAPTEADSWGLERDSSRQWDITNIPSPPGDSNDRVWSGKIQESNRGGGGGWEWGEVQIIQWWVDS